MPSSAPLPGFARFARRALTVLALAFVLAAPAGAMPQLVDAVEYYHQQLDHYFVTADPDEMQKLDTGFFQGWKRTGLSFKIWSAGTGDVGRSPVCRFYGSPAAGLDSHFYSASPSECDAVRTKFPDAWLFESADVFDVMLPNLSFGTCPAGTVPIYRAWNGRADSNHRYTTDPAVQRAMIAKGYVAEGYGPSDMPVAMCGPTVAASSPPSCNLNASDANPVVGTQVALTTSCTGSPTSFSWSNCSSTRGSCLATSSATGAVTYTVVASNAFGSSAPSSVTVSWRPPPPPPACTINVTAASDPPVAGAFVLLEAVCSNGPTAYAWTNCDSTTSRCTATSASAGAQTYSVVASNLGGSSPPASVTLNWVAAPPSGPDFCGSYPSVLLSSVGWLDTAVYSSNYTTPPGFAGNGVWAIRVKVPSGATATRTGRVAVAEFNGPPTDREVTVSRFACDFRAVDPSGGSGPLGFADGSSVTLGLALGASSAGIAGLTPGVSYYINIRNRRNGQLTCNQDRCDALMDLRIPR